MADRSAESRDGRSVAMRTGLLSGGYLVLCAGDARLFGPLVEGGACLVLPFAFIVVAFWLYRGRLVLYLLPALAVSTLLAPGTNGTVVAAGALTALTALPRLRPGFLDRAHAWRRMLFAGALASVAASAGCVAYRTLLHDVPPDLAMAGAAVLGQFGGLALLLVLLMLAFRAIRAAAPAAR